jgi:putative ABC transport system ATP-binding protein
MDALVEQTRQHGAAMVVVTHSVAAAKRADRVLTLTATGLVDYLDEAEIRMPDTPGRR